MPIQKAKREAWCDYCKNRFGVKSMRGQTPAVVSVISERRSAGQVRNYCNDCMLLVTHWACDCPDYRTCESRFTLLMQMHYGQEVQGEIDGI